VRSRGYNIDVPTEGDKILNHFPKELRRRHCIRRKNQGEYK
jgi:hypothetical protein